MNNMQQSVVVNIVNHESSFRRHFIKNFHSIWFASVMGTGIASTFLYRCPFGAEWLKVCGLIMFGITVCMFLLFSTIFILKNFCFYRNTAFLFDAKQSVFLGCYPMGLVTIINMITLIAEGSFNEKKWFYFIYILWVIDMIMSLMCSWGITFILFTRSHISDYKEHGFNATLLLPLVTMTVCAASGSLFYSMIPNEDFKLVQIIICFLLWANAICLSLPVIVIYFAKLYVTKIVPTSLIFTGFIPIGIMGQGSYGILLMGNNSSNYIIKNYNKYPSNFNNFLETALATANFFKFSALIIALFLSSLGFFLTFLASSSIFHGEKPKFFKKEWWAMCFPIGAMAIASSELGILFDFVTFKVIGCIYGATLVVLTIVCLIGSFIHEFPWHRK
ncbi:hypothetical protein PACTADRAFT_4552 [Pachysolen tannophilus NRRL Y-2460]|uniref:Sulfite efflux pump SSU1 n=1 Tax=Pachysolen tannophilus NRRL Y-2460 TaxID=669874 RepID=A0A1E4TPK9_PACTA|nr:hypothetical protein PACTADRAFT_4552 [Pachysolen tannophilus NRRL Y-2460]